MSSRHDEAANPVDPTFPQPPPGSSTVWQGVFLSGDGWTGARIAVTDLGDDDRAAIRIEIECDPDSDAGVHTREPAQQEPGLGLLVRATGLDAVNLLGDLLRAVAHKLDAVIALASASSEDASQRSEPIPPTAEPEFDLEEIQALLAARLGGSEDDL